MDNDNIYKKVRDYIIEKGLIVSGDTIVEGISGGADSVCLFLMLEELKKEIDFRTVAVHVHHGIRKKTADKDRKFVEDLCAANNVELKSYRKDIPLICKITKESEEECGRRIRYEIFDEVASLYENAKIAVAHHMNDQAETVIFRIIRGSGIKGLAGMESKRDNVIRPLLCLKREEIEQFLSDNGQKYRNDETNDTLAYSRNYIRKKIMPKLESVRANAVDHINALSGEAKEINDFMEKRASDLLDEAAKEADRRYITKGLTQKYKTDVLSAAEPILLKFAIRALIARSGVSVKDVTRSHVESLGNLITKEGSGQISLPRGVTVVKESGIVYIRPMEGVDGQIREILNVGSASVEYPSSPVLELPGNDVPEKKEPLPASEGFCIPIIGEGSYMLPDNSLVSCRLLNDFEMSGIPEDGYAKWMDYDKMSDDLCLRTRKTGDYLVINQKGNEGNLKNYMINEKIPKSERDQVPLIASGSKIYWVVGHRISEDVKVTPMTTRVIEFVYKRAGDDLQDIEEEEISEGAENG